MTNSTEHGAGLVILDPSAATSRILVVDDERDNLDLIDRALRHNHTVICTSSTEHALQILEEQAIAVLVSDQRMPEMTGVDLLKRALEISPDTIRVMLTGYADLESTIDAINVSRVHSFIRKPVRADEIEHALQSALELYRLRRQNRVLYRELEERNRELEEKERFLELSLDEKSQALLGANRRLEELAVRDGLTNLHNHRYFQERAEQEVQRALRYKHPLALAFFDLDHFKLFNDANGHPAGDEALKRVADILAQRSRRTDVIARLRGTDIVARYGGEEFVVLMTETPMAGAKTVTERLRAAIEEEVFPGEEHLPGGRLTVSVGLASLPENADNRTDLIEKADRALYQAKKNGRNCIYALAAKT